MKFCSACAQPVERKVPAGDNRPRYVCSDCGAIHYENPKLVVGCLAEWDDRVLLCRRAIEPRYGLWTLPAGFMENGESTAEAGARETLEEATARVEVLDAFSLIDIPHISQVYLIYRARLLEQSYSAGAESLEVALFSEQDIPWDALAFPAMTRTLRWYYEDRARGHFELHTGRIEPRTST